MTALALVILGVALLIFGEATAILTGLVCVVLGVSIVSFTILLRLQSAKNSQIAEMRKNQKK